MSINPVTQYPGKVAPATPDNPFGTARNITIPGDGTGTPWESALLKDEWALHHAMLLNAGMEPNGTPDSAENSQLFKAAKASIGNGANLLSNHNFIIASPDDSQPPPDATPRSYPPGFQIFSGVFANETTGITDLTYINGRASFTAGDFYIPQANSKELENITEFVASVADFDGKPRARGVSYALVGDEYRVTVGVDALEDESANETLLGSVKFEQGSVATGHEVGSVGLFDIYNTSQLKVDSVSEAKSLNAPAGAKIITSSYRNLFPSDTFGAAEYKKMTLADFGSTPDEYGDHTCDDGNVLKLVRKNPEVSQFGAWDNDPSKDSTEFFNAARLAAGTEQSVDFAYSTYYVNVTNWNKAINGNGASIRRFDGSTEFAFNFSSFAPNWNFKQVINVEFDGVDKSHVAAAIGYETDAVAGRWAFLGCRFLNGLYNVRKYSGNIGNRFINCRLGAGIHNFWAEDSSGTVMHTGADYWEGCHIDGFTVVGVYYKDGTLGYGQHTFNNVIFEEGPGNALVIRNTNVAGEVTYVPPRLESVWFEQSATGPDVELDDLGLLPPVNFWSIGIKGMSLDNGILNNSRIQNSNLSLSNMRLDNASTGVSGDIDIDKDSVVTCDNAIADTPGSIRCEVSSFQHTSRFGTIAAGGFTCFTPTRNTITANGFGSIRNTNSYNQSSSINVPGSISVPSIPVTPGFLGDAVHSITIAPGETSFIGGNSNIPSGELFIATINVRMTSGDQDDCNSRWAGDSGSLGAILIDRHSPTLWRCSMAAGKSAGQVNVRASFTNTSASPITIEVADVQVVSFTTERALISYINGRMFTQI